MTSNPVSLDEYLESRKTLVDQALELYLPAETTEPPVIFRSARYSVFAGESAFARFSASAPPRPSAGRSMP